MNGLMASACATTRPLVSAPSACPSSKKTAARARCRSRTVSCRATGGGAPSSDDGLLWLPRRDMMLSGLSGVAAGLAWYPGLASAADTATATAPTCPTADVVDAKHLLCTDTQSEKPCPLVSSTDPVVFTPEGKVKRVRQAAHLLSPENQAKYKEAVKKMKALPPSNPLSFAAQADIHQAYCDAYYNYLKEGNKPVFDVHFSWLFAPWHRMYLYFYERALGQLIGDDTFALPFWNWDNPAGMGIPDIFKKASDNDDNPLYDANRNALHVDALMDLDFLSNPTPGNPIPFKGPKDQAYKDLVNKNLATVYNQQVTNSGTVSYLGDKYCTTLGTSMSSMGSLERMVHTAVHVWTGKAGPTDPSKECGPDNGGFVKHYTADGKDTYNCNNDMGFLGAAGYDPLFYSHHSNVDRMWHIWSNKLGGGEGFDDQVWKETSFIFWDDVDNPRKVCIKFKDVLHTRNLGYKFDLKSEVDLPWLRPRITSLVPHGKDSASAKSKAPAPAFPLALTKGQVVVVPGVAVPAKEPGKEQLLVIDGIEFNPQKRNKFDVAINVPADKALRVGPQFKEYAGNFAVVPGSGGGTTRQGKVALCIDKVLSDIEADQDSTIDVVIVPRTDAKITISVSPTIINRN